MSFDSSVLGRFRGRGGTDTNRLREDEWFIPYKPSPSGLSPHSGIGYSPAPTRQTTNNLLSVFSSANSPNDNYRFPRAPPPNPAVGVQRLLPQRTALHRSPSHSSLIDSVPMSARLPSSSSVPTGLAAPKLLFSPLSREIRAGSSSMGEAIPTRQRTVSAPKPSRPHPIEGRHEVRRWAVPTMCDMFVLPRPHITPHVVTPPASPDEKSVDEQRVVEEGRARLQERDDWAEYVKQRGRSMSFGTQPATPGAPVIGNARARSRDHSRNNSLAKSDSRSSRLRTGSFGSRWSSRRGSSRRGSLSRGESKPSFLNIDSGDGGVVKSFDFVNQARRGSTARDLGRPSGQSQSVDFDVVDPFHSRRKSEQAAFRAELTKERSQREHTGSSEPSRQPEERPQRTLRIQQPPEINRGGVVVIGAGPLETPPSKAPSTGHSAHHRRRASPSLDLSKPLPSLPKVSPFAIDPFFPASSDSGAAASPVPVPTLTDASVAGSSTVPTTTSSMSNTLSENSPLHARAILQKQHQRAITKRAFQTPAHAPSAYRPTSTEQPPHSANSATFPTSGSPLSQYTSSTASSSNPSSGRRKTALEEAIGRSRAASVGHIETQDLHPVKGTLRTRPRTADGSDDSTALRPASSQRSAGTPSPLTATFLPSPQLVYPISTEVTPRITYSTEVSASFLAMKRPDFTHVDSAASGKTTYTDASEGWERSGEAAPMAQAARRASEGEVPSPHMNMDDRDFHVSATLLASS